jgi:hypothetical protein
MTLPIRVLLVQSILSDLFAGALYGLLCLGLNLSWGMLRRINLPQFALAFLGAYVAYELSTTYGIDPRVTLLLMVQFSFAIGAAIHALLSHFKVSSFNSMLVTFGVAVMVEALLQWIWTADYRKLESHCLELGICRCGARKAHRQAERGDGSRHCLTWGSTRRRPNRGCGRAGRADGATRAAPCHPRLETHVAYSPHRIPQMKSKEKTH